MDIAISRLWNNSPFQSHGVNMVGLMNGSSLPRQIPISERILLADNTTSLLEFALTCLVDSQAAIATLVEIRGGAARAPGSQVVVAADGRYAGYLSGGCVEAAVAYEALLAIEAGQDRVVKFGDGSPYFDIKLPCGGGITVAIHILREADQIFEVLTCLSQRKTCALTLFVEGQSVKVTPHQKATGWADGRFHVLYQPRTRIIISGESVEARSVAKLARCCDYDVLHVDDPSTDFPQRIDPFTAFLLLHHDIDQEQPALEVALRLNPFYIGALGSRTTHKLRLQKLRKAGFSDEDLAQIIAPIGLFGPARDSTTLALSVLAEVAAKRSGLVKS